MLHALVITPNSVDAQLALDFLSENEVPAHACASIGQLGGKLPDHTGCIVLVEEALMDPDVHCLHELLEAQATWSDLPLVLVASEGTTLSTLVERAFPSSGKVTLLERPLSPLTLISAVRTSLRARARQLQVRDLLHERKKALDQRDDFLAMLAHELRNPLAPMRNAIWLQKSLPMDDPLVAKTRDILDRQVTHLSRIVDDLMDVARLERGKVVLQRERLELNRAMLNALESSLLTTPKRSHEIVTELADAPLYVEADPVRLEQLLANLILNARKFTPPGGRIALQTHSGDGIASATVRDNGIGIQPEDLETLFTPFAQGEHGLARSTGGLGIGLSIARSIAELHGGTLRATSAGLSKGAAFELKLPLSPAPLEPVHGIVPTQTTELPRRILIVEDNADISESLRLVLSSWGHEVMLATTGDQGLAMALKERPDLALIDIGLPGMNGYDVARELRARSRQSNPDIRIIAMTGYGQQADRQRAADAGFHAHLVKPFDPEVLRPLVNARN